MKRLLYLIFLSALPLSAIDHGAADNPKIGLGVSINADTSTIKAPILLGQLRIEPELTWSYNDYDGPTSNSSFAIGSGLYLQKEIEQDLLLYFGGKLILGLQNNTTLAPTTANPNATRSKSTTGVELAGITGVEYFFTEHFSVGGEAGLSISFGNTTSFGTISAALLRYYF